MSGSETVCVGHHELVLPSRAKARFSTTYAGLTVQDKGHGDWDALVESLQARARRSESAASPRSESAESIYRAAGLDPSDAFSNSELVGFDVSGKQVVIAEHQDGTSQFVIEVHRLYDERHFVFEGKSAGAGRYARVRDGVLRDVSRFSTLGPHEIPASNGFCTGNGVFALKDRQDVGGDAQLYVTFPDYPGVKFSLNLYGLVERAEEPSFLERVGRDLMDLVGSGGKVRTLHRGSREYAGQKGKLVAISMPAEDGSDKRAYKYFWHAEGKPLDPFLPEIEAELMTDTDGTTVDADTIDALWEQIMGSLEPRTGNSKR